MFDIKETQRRDMTCPSCGDWLVVMVVAYGETTTCRGCKIRWTRLLSMKQNPHWGKWVAETYTSTGERIHG